MFHEKIKYINVQYHFIHNINLNDIVSKINTYDNPTEAKLCLITKFDHCLNLVNIYC